MGGGTGGRMRSGGRHWETECFAGPSTAVQSHRCPSRATTVTAVQSHRCPSRCIGTWHHPRTSVQRQLSQSVQLHRQEAS